MSHGQCSADLDRRGYGDRPPGLIQGGQRRTLDARTRSAPSRHLFRRPPHYVRVLGEPAPQRWKEDLELATRCVAGERSAQRTLYEREKRRVHGTLYRVFGTNHQIEDVIQEVFLQVYRSIKDFRGQSRFSTWLYRVTVNVVLMHRRAAKSRPVLQEASDAEGGAVATLHMPAAWPRSS